MSSIPGLFSLQRMPPPLLFQAIVRVRAIVLLFLGLGLGGKVRVKMLISPSPLGLGLGLGNQKFKTADSLGEDSELCKGELQVSQEKRLNQGSNLKSSDVVSDVLPLHH